MVGDFHVKTQAAACDGFANTTQADHAQFFSADAGAQSQATDFVFPIVRPHKTVAPGDVATGGN